MSPRFRKEHFFLESSQFSAACPSYKSYIKMVSTALVER